MEYYTLGINAKNPYHLEVHSLTPLTWNKTKDIITHELDRQQLQLENYLKSFKQKRSPEGELKTKLISIAASKKVRNPFELMTGKQQGAVVVQDVLELTFSSVLTLQSSVPRWRYSQDCTCRYRIAWRPGLSCSARKLASYRNFKQRLKQEPYMNFWVVILHCIPHNITNFKSYNKCILGSLSIGHLLCGGGWP